MQKILTKKIPGGKLLRIKMEADTVIQSISITGDFFLHPEESLLTIEKSLKGMAIESSSEQITQKIEDALYTESATFVGVTPKDISEMIVEMLATNKE